MQFDFQEFIQKTRKDEQRNPIISEFEQLFPKMLDAPLKEQNWYIDYVSLYDVIGYKTPQGIDFDWSLLMQLIAASFSTESLIEYEPIEGLLELVVVVSTPQQKIKKKISELFSMQVMGMMEAIVLEQINLQVLISKNEKEKASIQRFRQQKLEKWKFYLKEAQYLLDAHKAGTALKQINQHLGLFDFHAFIESLRNNEKKQQIVKKFEGLFPGMLQKSLFEQNWYLNYLRFFEVVPYKVPEELTNDFNWDLLLQLIVASFSSESYVEQEGTDSLRELIVTVSSGQQNLTKKISGLWSFQILRLFEIYIEEQINLQCLTAENVKEKEAIYKQREFRKSRWQQILEGKDPESITLSPASIPNRFTSSKNKVGDFSQFDFHKYIEFLRFNEEKKQTVERFEQAFPGMINAPMDQQAWYKEYISIFHDIPAYNVPQSLLEDFDWELLFMLIIASFSSTYNIIENPDGSYELEVTVKSGSQTITKRISELSTEQILRLYSIYIEEQINLQSLTVQDPKEKMPILRARKSHASKWIRINTLLQLKELEMA